MKKLRLPSLPAFIIMLTLITVGYLRGVADVPFHPDESSNIFMSGDLEIFFQQPSALFWKADQVKDIRQTYRLLNPPLLHLLTSLGRKAAGLPANPVDWDWGKTWVENQQAGALPSPALLWAGRMGSAVLFPFSILLFFLAVRRATNDFTAWAAALLLASNALVLLHTRRAMSEGGLLFTSVLCLWSLVQAEKRPWLTAIPAALAFSAKLTLAALAPVGLLSILWQPDSFKKTGLRRTVFQMVIFGGLMLGIIFLFNPVIWSQPISAIRDAVHARQTLASAQAGDRPQQTLNTPGLKVLGMIGGLYMTQPIFGEVSNYVADTRTAESNYMATPLNHLLSSFLAGALLLVLTLFGFCTACFRLKGAEPVYQRRMGLLLAATLIQALGLLVFIPLPWQRYYMPLVPFTCLWAAFGMDQLRERAALVLRQRYPNPMDSTISK